MNNHRARKRFGQNFLTNWEVIERIVRHINPQPEDNLVEIGPGKGAITTLLADICNHLHVIEIDRDLVIMLQRQFNNAGSSVKSGSAKSDSTTNSITIHQADALTVDFSSFTKGVNRPARVVGNLPYNISTPLIFHLLNFHDHIEDMYFMLQNEVVDRLIAQPDDKHYGRLSIMVQYHCQTDKLFEVPSSCFDPQPKVNSAVIRLTPHKPPPYVADNPDHLSRLVNCVFQQRRKTLHNALKPFMVYEKASIKPASLPIDTRLRPENLSVEDYVKLSNFLFNEKSPDGAF